MTLSDSRLVQLEGLVKNSFRVRPNHDPVYVDLEGNLDRVASPQHQVIYGRRGSGKSCLLVAFHRHHHGLPDIRTIYIEGDEVKRLSYPDLLVRLLISILGQLPQRQGLFRRQTLAKKCVAELEQILDQAENRDVSESRSSREAVEAEAGAKGKLLNARSKAAKESAQSKTSTFKEDKLQHLERHLEDYKNALADGVKRTGARYLALVVDDFYLIAPAVQPDVVDYLHRLCRGKDAYLKIATIRHRSQLVRYEHGQTIGLEPKQDYEVLDLDKTFEDVTRTRDQLASMLDSMGEQVGVETACADYLAPGALQDLTLASGGVPRDFLNVFVEAVALSRAAGKDRWLTPSYVYKGSARELYQSKVLSFREDAGGDVAHLERVFQDLMIFCLKEKKKTAFLVSQSEAQSDPDGHELIKQLMDLKLIHVIEPDTSAASGRPGRYEAYTLDFAVFMEPRKRGIEIVEFWRKDDQRRVAGVREAPVYDLSRARHVAEGAGDADIESANEALATELGADESTDDEVWND